MTRLDLAFILCCCKACLVSNKKDEESFYDLLDVETDATRDEIKRAYKRQSLQMHPDKLAQKGQEVTEELQERFTRMKEAYDVLADPHKRESYDTIGEVGMKWIDEPFSIDPQEMAHNFSTSSTVDRLKIFTIFVVLAIIILIIPILVCLQVDGIFGPESRWVALLTPLWIYDAIIFFYHIRVVMMGPISKPDHIPEEDWVDPLPLHKRVFSLVRFLLLLIFEILAAMRLDDIIKWKWSFVFMPLFIFEAIFFLKRFSAARTEIITAEEVEYKFGKPFTQFTQSEKETFLLNSFIVPSKTSSEFANAELLRYLAREDIMKLTFRVAFLVLLLFRLDTDTDWSWWLVFAPYWALAFCLCCFNLQNAKQTTEDVAEQEASHDPNTPSHYGAMEEGGDGGENMEQKEPLSEADQAVLQNRVTQSMQRLLSSCCSSIFFLILLSMTISKAQGAEYASMWIISPFLIIASLVLCLVGCAIFGVSPIDETEDIDVDDPENASEVAFGGEEPASYAPPITPIPVTTTTESFTSSSAPQMHIPHTTMSVEEIWSGKLEETDKPMISNNFVPLDVTDEKKAAVFAAPAQPIDLLDDISLPLTSPNNDISMIEPTASEVDDLD